MLHRADMTLLKNDKCNEILRKATKTKLPSSKFCGDSGGGKTGVCKVPRVFFLCEIYLNIAFQYDFGGPVISFANGVPQLVGIISDVDVCGSYLPNIFTSLGPVYDFVNKFIKKNWLNSNEPLYFHVWATLQYTNVVYMKCTFCFYTTIFYFAINTIRDHILCIWQYDNNTACGFRWKINRSQLYNVNLQHKVSKQMLFIACRQRF